MTKRALVLAGGGIAGIAWETGVLRGIADEAPDTARALLGAEILVGTSAGSTVAAQIGSGLGIEALYDRQLVTTSAEIDPGVSIETITGVFLAAMSDPDANVTKKTITEKLRRIGEIALSTPTVAEDVRRAVIEQRLPSHEWPDRDLRVTAIDTAKGELVTFDRSSGVSLVDAVAASCAVPGVWPPVTIGPRRFMDGGVGSTVNMGVAADCDAAVALVPSGRSSPSPFGSGAVAEVDGFAAPTFGIFADDEALAAFGPNPLDPACRVPSAEAGRAQGRRVAADVAGFFSGLQ
ncbi:patatin-like phospholipase family protein [Mycolicibacterium baixiangningiae]|uniref:patatin-like phospholipase family protein n=1 Tax=Mycolicibacterium baixiangningiae TaxID=2761578 RepID=UPI001E658284|nr:patatin-like phospholipase family protein [Mycolicibacterium baixiangningiae]